MNRGPGGLTLGLYLWCGLMAWAPRSKIVLLGAVSINRPNKSKQYNETHCVINPHWQPVLNLEQMATLWS